MLLYLKVGRCLVIRWRDIRMGLIRSGIRNIRLQGVSIRLPPAFPQPCRFRLILRSWRQRLCVPCTTSNERSPHKPYTV